MPIAPKLEVPTNWPGFPLAQKLERYLWLSDVTPVHEACYHGRLLHYEVRGIVRWPLTTGPDGEVCEGEIAPVPDPADQEESYIRASAVRESLMRWANTAITAAEGMGYRHTRHPQIDVGGDVHVRYKEPEKPDLLICRVEVRTWLTEAKPSRSP